MNAPQLSILRVYGDSLSMPRITDGIMVGETFAELLRDRLSAFQSLPVRLYNRSRGGVTADALYRDYISDATYFGEGESTALVIQCGIVDCAPRPVPPLVRRLIGALPDSARSRVIRTLHEKRANLLRFGPTWRETSPRKFQKTCARWFSNAAEDVSRVAVVNIAPTTPAIEAHSPGLMQGISAFNELLARAVSDVRSSNIVMVDVYDAIVTPSDGVETCINARDGHHITPRGHELYARLIAQVLTREL